jgi:hypothetical protein
MDFSKQQIRPATSGASLLSASLHHAAPGTMPPIRSYQKQEEKIVSRSASPQPKSPEGYSVAQVRQRASASASASARRQRHARPR